MRLIIFVITIFLSGPLFADLADSMSMDAYNDDLADIDYNDEEMEPMDQDGWVFCDVINRSGENVAASIRNTHPYDIRNVYIRFKAFACIPYGGPCKLLTFDSPCSANCTIASGTRRVYVMDGILIIPSRYADVREVDCSLFYNRAD